MRSLLFAAVLVAGLAFRSTGIAQQAKPSGPDAPLSAPRVLPIPPKDILMLLPPTPSGWKVTGSVATNQVSSWLVTIAQRQIEGPLKDVQTKSPPRTIITLID